MIVWTVQSENMFVHSGCSLPYNKATKPAPAAKTPPSPMIGIPVMAGAESSVAELACALASEAALDAASEAAEAAEPA